jgi:DNA-directed RNA polymerase subunit K/omega
MKPLELAEIVDIDAYEPQRDAYRARVVAAKRARRMAVGDRVMLLFENRETVRFQVQEMLRVERIRAPEKVQNELDVYNELLPQRGELSATLMIEITEPSAIRAELDRMLGIDTCVFLVLGDAANAVRVRASFDTSQLDEDRISAVHYLRFPLSPEARSMLRDPAIAAQIAIDHDHYRVATALPHALRASLVADLDADPAPLLAPAPGTAVTQPRVRVRKPALPLGRGHVVVEAVSAQASWFDADPALEAELLAELKRCAREITAAHGSCRVFCDVHAPGLRWNALAPK